MNKYNALNYSLNFVEMQHLNKDAKLIVYTELNKIKNINDLFKDTDKLIILYLLQNNHSGHYVCLFKGKNCDFEFFDSYGMEEDGELKMLSPIKRHQFNEEKNRLTELLDKYFVIYNNIQYQTEKTETCGMFVTHRLNNSFLDCYQYYKYMKKLCKSNKYLPDEIVAYYVLNKL